MDCPLHIQNGQSVFIIILYTRNKEYISTNCGDQTERNVPETKSKTSCRVSLLYSVLQADWTALLTFMVYLTMLSRSNITGSAYGILPLGHCPNVVRGFVCSGHLESCAAGCISWQVHPSQTGQMLKGGRSFALLGRALSMRLIASPYETVCINKHNGCCHMENVEMAKRRTMSCVLLLGMCSVYSSHKDWVKWNWNWRNTTVTAAVQETEWRGERIADAGSFVMFYSSKWLVIYLTQD
jgi:hypothetical protein